MPPAEGTRFTLGTAAGTYQDSLAAADLVLDEDLKEQLDARTYQYRIGDASR